MKFVLASLLLGAVWGIFEIGLVLFSDQKIFSAFQAGNPQLMFSFAIYHRAPRPHRLSHGSTSFRRVLFTGQLKHLKILVFPRPLAPTFQFSDHPKGRFHELFNDCSLLPSAILPDSLFWPFNFKKLA